MNRDVIVVRVYLAEGRDDISGVLKWLEKSEVRGFTLFRGVAGFGSDKRLLKASLLDLSSDLPLVIEFFDQPDRAQALIAQLENMVKPDHILSWPAQTGT